jgi:hypothetical protein
MLPNARPPCPRCQRLQNDGSVLQNEVMTADELQAAELLMALKSSNSPPAAAAAWAPKPPPKFPTRQAPTQYESPSSELLPGPRGSSMLSKSIGNPVGDMLLQQVVLSILSRPNVAAALAHQLKHQLQLPCSQPPAKSPSLLRPMGSLPGSARHVQQRQTQQQQIHVLPSGMEAAAGQAGLMALQQDWTVSHSRNL